MKKYQKASREYTVLGISAVFKKIVSNEFSIFFDNNGPEDILFVVKDGNLFHFQVEEEVKHASKGFLQRINRGDLDLEELYIETEKKIVEIEKMYKMKPIDYTLDIFSIFLDLYTKLIMVAYAVSYSADFSEVLDKDKRDLFDSWVLKIRKRIEKIYKDGENIFIPEYTKWLSENELSSYSQESLTYLFADELREFITKNKKLPSEEDLASRKKLLYARFYMPEKFNHETNSEAEKEIVRLKLFEEEQLPNVNSLKGQTAQKGFAKGMVRIILKRSDIDKFIDGEIIVAPMTDPSYLPIMRNALAFVTDEGGTLCHAAIVARELKKPCIIGTKIATRVLKDGMEVEVDANKGIVKIINY